MSVSRRNFLRGAAVGATRTALTGGFLAANAHADTVRTATSGAGSSSPFHGSHQAGALTPVQPTSRTSPASPRSTLSPAPPWPT